ncbi:sensor histidine kinase, partial [Paenibacillus sonchi]|nr:sensor histidine kinase [Paenibacillus sonchi]
ELFEDIAFEYEYELAGLDIELTCRHSFTDSIWLTVNEPMIRRVFGNLFSNAVRYSIIEHHGGEIVAYSSEYGGLGIRFSLPLAVQR